MKYMPVKPYGEWTSAERADLINKELYNLSRPITVKDEKDMTSKLFGEVTHPETGQVALQIDEEYEIRVHPDKDISNLQNLFSNLSDVEIQGLSDFIDAHSSFKFKNIIPSTSEVLTREEAEQAGWFTTEEV